MQTGGGTVSLPPEVEVNAAIAKSVPIAVGASYVRLVRRVTSGGEEKKLLLVVKAGDMLLCNTKGEVVRKTSLGNVQAVLFGQHPSTSPAIPQVLIRTTDRSLDTLLLFSEEEVNLPPSDSPKYFCDVITAFSQVLFKKSITFEQASGDVRQMAVLRTASRGSESMNAALDASASLALPAEVQTEGSSDRAGTPEGRQAGKRFCLEHRSTQGKVSVLQDGRLVVHLKGDVTPGVFTLEARGNGALLALVDDSGTQRYIRAVDMPHVDGTTFLGLYAGAPEDPLPEDTWHFNNTTGLWRHNQRGVVYPKLFNAQGVQSAFMALGEVDTSDPTELAFSLIPAPGTQSGVKESHLTQHSTDLRSGRKQSATPASLPPPTPSASSVQSIRSEQSAASAAMRSASEDSLVRGFEAGYGSFFKKYDKPRVSEARRHAGKAVGREATAYRELLHKYPKAAISDADFLRRDSMGEVRREVRKLRKMVHPAASTASSRSSQSSVQRTSNDATPVHTNKYLISLTEHSAQRREESMQGNALFSHSTLSRERDVPMQNVHNGHSVQSAPSVPQAYLRHSTSLGPKRDSLYTMGWEAARSSPQRDRPLPVSPLAPTQSASAHLSFTHEASAAPPPGLYEEGKYITHRTPVGGGCETHVPQSYLSWNDPVSPPQDVSEGQWRYIDRYNAR